MSTDLNFGKYKEGVAHDNNISLITAVRSMTHR